MTVVVKDFVDYAEHTTKRIQPAEIDFRSAISRAYYGAYHHCEFWNKNLSIQGNGGATNSGMHASLIHRLQNPIGDPTHPSCDNARRVSVQKGAHLGSLKKERVIADYDLNASLGVEHAARVIERVKLLISL